MFQGEHIDLGATVDDYSVLIAGEPCDVTKLFSDQLYCRLDNAMHHTADDLPSDVNVSAFKILAVCNRHETQLSCHA